MPIELERGSELGTFKDFSKKVENRGFLKSVPTALLRKELRMRENDDPIFDFLKHTVEEAESKGITFSPDRFVYELSRDSLGRPNFYLGYNVSDFTLEEIVEQDKKIKKGEIPERLETPIIWTDLLVIYDGILRRYVGGFEEVGKDLQEYVINPFIKEIAERGGN